MFEMDFDETKQLFRKFSLDPECGERYVVTAKACNRNGNASDTFRVTGVNIKVTGILLKYDSKELSLGDVWIEKDISDEVTQDGNYSELVTIEHKSIQKIDFAKTFDFKPGLAYRAEIYQKNQTTGRPTTWISCYYRGTTHSGKIMLVTLSSQSEIMILGRRDIKVFSPLSLDEIKLILEKDTTEVEEEA